MFTHAASFVAGVVTGWTARSVLGSTREVSVRVMMVALAARDRMRRSAAEQVELWEDLVAEARSRHPGARYLAGSAEDMPVPSGSADYALMFLSWHHVQDKPQAVRELARVLRPGGRLLLRANFSDHHPRPWWLEHFPRGYAADAALFQPLHEVIAMFTSAGWRVASYGTVTEPSSGTRGDALERLRLRTLSLFAQLSPDEVETGLRRLEQAVAADPGAPAPVFAEPLLTLERCQ